MKNELLSSNPGSGIDIVRADGAEYLDSDGKRYIDLNEMCIVLGQNNAAFNSAMEKTFGGITTDKLHPSGAEARLRKYLYESNHGLFSWVHFTVSGSEAVEWAVKLAKRRTGRTEAISFWNSIHGRTELSASMSGLPRRKTGYGPLAPGGVFAPYPNCSACPINMQRGACGFACIDFIERKCKYESAGDAGAIIIEPYQGVGIAAPPDGYMKALFIWAKSRGMLFIMDETQSGMGRTGTMYRYEKLGVEPDMLILGKALGNGMHISCLLSQEAPDPAFMPAILGGVGDYTPACAAGCEVFRQLETGLIGHIQKTGEFLGERLKALEKSSSVAATRCFGLAAAIEFFDGDFCSHICAELLRRGFIVGHSVDPHSIVLKPPYVITEAQLAEFTDTLTELLGL